MTPARWVALARCAWGATCLLVPGRVARAAGTTPDEPAVLFARVLGARELAQGLVTLAAPVRMVADVGTGVDAVHALTVVGLARGDRRRRRPALVNAATATGWALLGALTRPACRA